MHQSYHYRYLVLAYLMAVSIQTFIVNVFDYYSITLLMTLGIILLIALSGYILFFRLEKLYVEENVIVRQNLILNKSKVIPFDNIRYYSKQKRKLKDGKEITEFTLYLNHYTLTKGDKTNSNK
ncbi:hypothetical protein, partial [Flammeovirga sp. OC4]|uniref:hypothetical protein n=1 Tax=Flammeovirga sp. OC4 TaxID=1382345 RepID=UPI001C0FC34A